MNIIRFIAVDIVSVRARAITCIHVAVAFTLLFVANPSAQAGVTCTVSAVGPAFKTYDPLSPSPNQVNGSVTADCKLTGNTTTTVNLTSSYSKGNSGTYSSRSMKSGNNVLSYNLYYDDAYTQIRGDGTGGSITGGATFTLTRTSNEQSQTSVIYGRIPAGQDVAAGSYSDTIVVTITY